MADSDPTPARPSAPSRRAAWRRWAKRLLGVALAVALTEIGAAGVYLVQRGEGFSYAAMRARRAALEAPTDEPPARDGAQAQARALRPELDEQALHPFVGFLNDPTGDPWAASPPYAHAARLFEDGPPGTLRVLVVGGSVAGQVRDQGDEALRAAIAQGPFEGREVEAVSLAVGGYKQPQQLALVAYLLSAGARFDVLINIDGFNEAVLPWTDNAQAGVYPLYPRWWDLRLASVDEPETLARVGAIQVYRDLRRSAAQAVDGSPLRLSVTANVAWDALDRWAERRVYERTRALARDREARSYQRAGPPGPRDRDATLALAADNWARSSILMHRIASQEGFLYIHVLQPNQYLEGTKPLSDEERRLYLDLEGDYGQTAPLGYAQLLARAPRLREVGVRFHDLTRLFADEPATVYADTCCHFNAHGVDRLATRIGELVAADAAEAGAR